MASWVEEFDLLGPRDVISHVTICYHSIAHPFPIDGPLIGTN